MSVGAYFYNHRLARHGAVDAVLNVKDVPPELRKAVVADVERGLSSEILPHPWQSETCIGQWHYREELYEQPGEFGGYLPPADAIHWMADTVSKNGTFILNVPGRPDGTIDSKERKIVEEIGKWMKINGEAIYSTRPWKVFGEGPAKVTEGKFQGESIKKVTAEDIRYTRNKAGTVIYAIALGCPEGKMTLRSLGTAAATKPGKVAHVELLGSHARPVWTQTASALNVTLPRGRPAMDYSAALKIHLA
jgi:alpha-L-fucosidase